MDNFVENQENKVFKEKIQNAFRLRDRIGEKINCLEGHTERGSEHADAGFHYLIGLHVPEWAIEEALAATNDAKMNSMAGRAETLKEPAGYFTRTLQNICHNAGLYPPINWRKE